MTMKNDEIAYRHQPYTTHTHFHGSIYSFIYLFIECSLINQVININVCMLDDESLFTEVHDLSDCTWFLFRL